MLVNKKDSVGHERTSRFLLSSFEQFVLPRMASALPKWVKPDHLTLLGLVAATGIGISYILSKQNTVWLWFANFLLVVHWCGDSLDGTLARVRKAERPRYGFYLDHLTDAYATLVIGLGLGLSPYMTLAVGLSIVISYLLLSINVYLETYIFGKFSSSYARLGPTEVRVMLILLNTAAITQRILPFKMWGFYITLFDIIGVAATIGMLILLIQRAMQNLRTLAALEPPIA